VKSVIKPGVKDYRVMDDDSGVDENNKSERNRSLISKHYRFRAPALYTLALYTLRFSFTAAAN